MRVRGQRGDGGRTTLDRLPGIFTTSKKHLGLDLLKKKPLLLTENEAVLSKRRCCLFI